MSTTAGSGVEVVAIDTPALGDRSYLAHDGEVALVVDPQRDIDRVLALAAARGCGSPTSSKPTCTTTTSPAGWRWRTPPRRPTTSTGPTRWPSTVRRPATGT